MAELQAWMNLWRDRVDAALAAALDRESDAPPRLRQALRYSLLAPGKRLRPLLVLLAAEAVGGNPEPALPPAVALEMVHCYSLVHDDLPGMDNDDLRRGRPTCHKEFDEATAILVGDGLLTLAFQTVAEQVRPAELAVRACAELARGAGVAGMVGGQMDDLLYENRTDVDRNLLESIHQRKTGALFRVALRIGAWVGAENSGGLRPEEEACLAAFAKHLGLAFQIADDLLDAEGSEASTGKKVGKDAARGKLTYPGLLGVAESRRLLAAVCSEAEQALTPLGNRAAKLRDLVRIVATRDR